jgi:SAM-dependent methyltransferase
MKTLDYVIDRFNLDVRKPSPIEIPNIGRNDLPHWLHELNFKTGVEVGVAAGEYSELIAKVNPQMKVYGIDIWKGYHGYKHYIDDDTFAGLFGQAQKRLSQYRNYEFIRELSADALAHFDDNELDFVYLDANHEGPYVSDDIREWYKKIKPGGILAGHDYVRPGSHRRNSFDAREKWSVIDAVNRYVKENNIRPWFILGLKAKIPGTIRDNNRSWMWVKQ